MYREFQQESRGVILYAEDDPSDAILFQRAFKQAGVKSRVVVVPNGKTAIDYLNGNGLYADRAQHPLPCLVLLDLKMPAMSGLEVLQWIRGTPELSTLIVLMLTSSNQDSDIQRAYKHGANAYLVKPNRLEDIVALAQAIRDFWLVQNWSHLLLPSQELASIPSANGNGRSRGR
ncbi:MAG: response regulator [Verrucomicrobiota bacterium]|jgi:CheY-like chemotaxis protein